MRLLLNWRSGERAARARGGVVVVGDTSVN